MCVRRFWDPAPDVWGLWVPKTSVPSRDLLIFVDQASEQAGTSHLLWWWSVGVCRAVGWSLAECAVWPMGVVVPEVGSQDCGEVVAAEDEDPIGALAADGADPAFGESVRPGGAHRVRMTVICSEVKTASKPATNLVSRSRIRKRSCSTRSPMSTPRWARATWGRIEASPVEDQPHGRWRHPMRR
jgi:hypothetical protein